MSTRFYAGQKDYIAKLNEMDDAGVRLGSSYYGAFSSAPAARPDGSAKVAGDRYFDTTLIAERTWNGTAWYVPNVDTAALAATSGSSLVGYPRPVTGTAMTIKAYLDELNSTRNRHQTSSTAFIEQHLTSFFGRGMLTAETINTTTEQAFVGAFSAGATTVVATDATNLLVGGCLSIKHDNGKYGTYFIDSKSTNNLGIRPALRYDCTTVNAKLERTWYNRAHPGKFYMRELAQRLANSTEADAAQPNGRRILFTNVASNPNTIEDTLVAIGGAAISYNATSNLGETGTTSTPVRFALGRSAYIDTFTAINQGCETQLFPTVGVAQAVVKVAFLASTTLSTFAIQVLDENGKTLGTYSIPGGANHRVLQIYTLQCDVRAARQIKVRVICETFNTSAGYIVIDQVDVFEAPNSTGKIISKPGAKIVCIGDSWAAGDLVSTAQREPYPQQLAIELPYATIINAGVGGNKITDILARFDTDVTPYAPDYVIVNTGTNECYSPLSGTFIPNAVDAYIDAYRKVINKILALGARPIIIGGPALAQSDVDVSGFAEWLLNDRAKQYAQYVFENQGLKPYLKTGSNANGSWIKSDDGTMICTTTVTVTTTAALTAASAVWTFPVPFVATPKVEANTSGYSTNQLISTGTKNNSTTTSTAVMVSGTSGIALPVDCIAIGRWY